MPLLRANPDLKVNSPGSKCFLLPNTCKSAALCGLRKDTPTTQPPHSSPHVRVGALFYVGVSVIVWVRVTPTRVALKVTVLVTVPLDV